MWLYIAATNRVISVVIAVEREEEGKTVQRPVYYLSEVISISKQNYPHYQKMAYGVWRILGGQETEALFFGASNHSGV